jgi:hypothetical protein
MRDGEERKGKFSQINSRDRMREGEEITDTRQTMIETETCDMRKGVRRISGQTFAI